MSSDYDRFLPSSDQPGNVLAYDGFSEHGAAEHVPDRTVGTLPHLLQLEFLDSLLVRRDGRALNADIVLLHGLGTVQRHLVVGQVTVLHAQIEDVELDVQERQNELLFD